MLARLRNFVQSVFRLAAGQSELKLTSFPVESEILANHGRNGIDGIYRMMTSWFSRLGATQEKTGGSGMTYCSGHYWLVTASFLYSQIVYNHKLVLSNVLLDVFGIISFIRR